jgi:hypothetical protein
MKLLVQEYSLNIKMQKEKKMEWLNNLCSIHSRVATNMGLSFGAMDLNFVSDRAKSLNWNLACINIVESCKNQVTSPGLNLSLL